MRNQFRKKVRELMRSRGMNLDILALRYSEVSGERATRSVMLQILSARKPKSKRLGFMSRALGVNPSVFGYGKITTWLAEVGMSQKEFGKKMGTSLANASFLVRRYEVGPGVGLATLRKFARVTGKPVAWFL